MFANWELPIVMLSCLSLPDLAASADVHSISLIIEMRNCIDISEVRIQEASMTPLVSITLVFYLLDSCDGWSHLRTRKWPTGRCGFEAMAVDELRDLLQRLAVLQVVDYQPLFPCLFVCDLPSHPPSDTLNA